MFAYNNNKGCGDYSFTANPLQSTTFCGKIGCKWVMLANGAAELLIQGNAELTEL